MFTVTKVFFGNKNYLIILKKNGFIKPVDTANFMKEKMCVFLTRSHKKLLLNYFYIERASW
jgi:hypothetical protein